MSVFCIHVPEERLELSHPRIHDFESCASTIPPLRLILFYFYSIRTQQTLPAICTLVEWDHSLVVRLLASDIFEAKLLDHSGIYLILTYLHSVHLAYHLFSRYGMKNSLVRSLLTSQIFEVELANSCLKPSFLTAPVSTTILP